MPAITTIKPRNIDITGDYVVNSISASGNIVAANVKTDSLLYSNGSPYALTTNAAGSNTQIQFNDANSFAGSANLTFDKSTNTLSVTNIIANGAGLTSIAGANVTGQVGNATVAGTVYTNAQPNITSVGTLTSLNVTGISNLGAVTNVVITGGTANYILKTDGAGNLSWIAQPSTDLTGYATESYVSNSIANLVNSAPTVLDTLSEIANAIGNDASFSTTITNSLANKFNTSDFVSNANTAIDNRVTKTFIDNLAVVANIANTAHSVAGANVTGTVANANYAAFAGNITVNAQPNITSVGTLSNLTVSGNITTANANVTGTLTANTISTSGSSGNISGANVITANFFVGNGNSLSNIAGANVTGFVSNANVANTAYAVAGSNVSGQVANATVAGTVYTNAQPNITSVGTLTTLSVSGNISAGNANLGNAVSANFFVGNGSLLTGLPASYSNSDVANYLPTYTGNISAGNITVTSNITTSNANITGTLTANLISTSGSGGNISGANNITANFFIGNGSSLSALTGANVTGFVANANVANTAYAVSGANVTGQVSNATVAGTVYTNAQPNITSVGTLTSLSVTGNVTAGNLISNASITAVDAIISGNLTVSGTTTTVNSTTTRVVDPIFELGGGSNGAALTTNDNKDRGTLLHYYSGNVIDAFMGWDSSNAEFAFGSNVSVSSEVITFNTLGNVRAGYFIGNGSQLTGLPASYANSDVANYLPTYTGNLSAGNANLGNAVTANFFVGDGSLLTGIATSASSNTANTANTVTTNAQPNITSLGTLTSLNVSGNVSFTGANVSLGNIANLYIPGGNASQFLQTDGAGNLVWADATANAINTVTVDTLTGNGIQTTFSLSVSPSHVNDTTVNYNGATLLRSSYSINGANITFDSAPAANSEIEVTTVQLAASGNASFTTRTYTGNGSDTTYTVTSGATVSSVLVTLDGVLQTPTSDYTILGNTLTFVSAPDSNVAIQIREMGVATALDSSTTGKNIAMNILFGF
jgi:hypothetical protein